MHTNDNNAKPEQRRPDDVKSIAGDNGWGDAGSMAPPLVQPPGEKDESERPIVDPVTGAPL